MNGMEILHVALLVLHFVGLGAVVYGVLAQLNRAERRITPAVVHGATTQLLTGLALVGVLEAGDEDVDHVKVAVKLLVALGVVGIAHSRRRSTSVGSALFWVLLGLEALNVVVALAW
jgi:hypothetical protein